MNIKQIVLVAGAAFFTLGSASTLADGYYSQANKHTESKVYLLHGAELAEYYINKGEATAAGTMSTDTPTMNRQEQFKTDGLTPAQRKRIEVGNDN